VETVAVCDTEPIAIEGLRSLLESAEGLRVVATENSLADGMDAVHELRPDILILDRAFGLNSILDCPRTLRKLDSRTAVIVWGVSMPEGEALRILQSGAS
jgi:DNA-binding NarL/FixJ family response regulator